MSLFMSHVSVLGDAGETTPPGHRAPQLRAPPRALA
jgi:hypothetical protein